MCAAVTPRMVRFRFAVICKLLHPRAVWIPAEATAHRVPTLWSLMFYAVCERECARRNGWRAKRKRACQRLGLNFAVLCGLSDLGFK